ncbi:MAG: L,D-transpeptidase [Bacteroidales bacterium]|jgi:lipoprotein-anchoring transpeptidase ErfK/SrfK|nr:L,D-transpeptidase [Bacteroidales bacterium]MDO4999538.1 L,D-transpeptidase [Bacteroidales bacterium]
MNKRILLLALLLLPALSAGAQGRFAKYLHRVDEAPFILIDKQAFKLWLVDGRGEPIKEYGISCAVNYGQKQRRGDHKTPEGTFKINQLLNSRGIPHDFGDGKGPIPDAYGPWFLRLDVPGFRDIGIHGTPFPESIGTRATEGCIRLRNEDITDLKGRVKLGTTVIILPDISH